MRSTATCFSRNQRVNLQTEGLQRPAFTLVELLIVIGIIALLISILLPAMSQARHSARTVICASNLRQIGLGLQLYVNENEGFFPGPNTSGLGLYRGGQYSGDSSSPTQDWDWVSPCIGKMLNLSKQSPTETADNARLRKMREIMENKLRCPENEYRYGALYSGSALPGTGLPLLMSYNSPAYIHVLPKNAGYSSTQYSIENEPSPSVSVPANYVPKINRVGAGSKKIFAFEGARFWNTGANAYFDFSTDAKTAGLYGKPQGAFSSRGLGGALGATGEPYDFDSSTSVNPAASKPAMEFKLASLRHDGRMQAVFFDGHVELMSFMDAAPLEHWAPKGSKIGVACFYNSMVGNNKRYYPGTLLP
jgi:prepilin-type processing-associated H-X9-DG protein/prepilin-type N-terminal cleavage/methylation domain-containing protein